MFRRTQSLAVTLALACGPAPAGTGTGTGPSTTSTGDPPLSTSTGPEPTTGESSSTGGKSFIVTPDQPVHHPPCNPWAQDCPEGQKCVPWAPIGQNQWTDAKCVDVIGDGAPGDPCTAPEGGGAGIDDCALGSFCFDLDENNQGVCFLQCSGTPDTPVCPPNAVCGSDQYVVLALCFSRCDPFLQDCPETQICIPNIDDFYCYNDQSGDGGQVNDPCIYGKDCDPGLECVESATASMGCDPRVSGCCQPYCKLPGGSCPNPDQQCLPLQPIVPGHADVGICSLPS